MLKIDKDGNKREVAGVETERTVDGEPIAIAEPKVKPAKAPEAVVIDETDMEPLPEGTDTSYERQLAIGLRVLNTLIAEVPVDAMNMGDGPAYGDKVVKALEDSRDDLQRAERWVKKCKKRATAS